jgi:hypothetical protein
MRIERSQLQSLQSHQLRAEQHRDRSLRARSATKADGLACHGAADAAPRVAADDAWKTFLTLSFILSIKFNRKFD